MTNKKTTKPATKTTRKAAPAEHYVLVRSSTSGVHIGRFVRRVGRMVELDHARRIYSWTGALSCSELATRGPGAGSRLGDPVHVTVLDAFELIDVLPAAKEVVASFPRWVAS